MAEPGSPIVAVGEIDRIPDTTDAAIRNVVISWYRDGRIDICWDSGERPQVVHDELVDARNLLGAAIAASLTGGVALDHIRALSLHAIRLGSGVAH